MIQSTHNAMQIMTPGLPFYHVTLSFLLYIYYALNNLSFVAVEVANQKY